MREVPLEHNEEAFRFAERLFRGEFDMIVLLTGGGTRYLAKVLETRYPAGAFAEALRKLTVVARGPKPAGALREMDVPVSVSVPEPNTWREIVEALKDRPERRIAVQLYGKSHPELLKALIARGAEVTPVPVYKWQLPEDLEPLREAVIRLAEEAFEVTLWTTSQQIVHLMEMARQMDQEEAVREGIRKSVVASIGPTTSEALREYGFEPDLEPSHPRLGLLVKEAAEQSAHILWKRKKI
jgi:uroporphyrinogen-III synthase